MPEPSIKNEPKIVIVVINYNGFDDTAACLESLQRIAYENFNVIVVDNGSEDESIEKINDNLVSKNSVI